jgi:alpha-1,6-mannosyltransferase
VLLVLVGGVHNDALMLGLAVAGVALAVSSRGLWGLVLGALGVAVKPPALLVVGAVCWWAWGRGLRARAKGVLVGAISVFAVLVVTGAGVGGGFGWLKALSSYGSIPGSFSLGARFLDVKSGPLVDAIEVAGVALAVLLVIAARAPGRWIAATGWGLALLAVTTAKPEPWYLAWAIMLLACGGLHRRSEVLGVLVLAAMMAGSAVALGVFWWFAGVILLSWLAITSLLFRPPIGPNPHLQEANEALAKGDKT